MLYQFKLKSVMKKILLLLSIAGVFVFAINAQKRNMFPVYSFEVTGENLIGNGGNGHLFVNSGNLTTTIDNSGAISGKALKVVVDQSNVANTVKYYLEVFEDDVLEIRFKVKADRETAFNFELTNASGTGNDLLTAVKKDVSTEVQEYVFRTEASTGNTIQGLTFNFGTEDTETGSTFYVDDLSIIKVNTDWDGNLIKNGKFDIPSLNYSLIDYNQNGDHHTFDFDDTDALESGNSLKITTLRTGADWIGNLKSFYVGNGTQYRISYNLKIDNIISSAGGNVKVGIGRSWDLGNQCFGIPPWPADGFKWQDASREPIIQSFDLTFNEEVVKGSDNNHFIYAFGWYDVCTMWLDNLNVEQIGLQTIEIVEWEKANSTLQLWVNATPSSAQNKVIWTIDETNSTGAGTIDEDGLLTVTTPGIIGVKAESIYKAGVETTKDIDCSDMTATSLKEIQKEVVYTEYYSLTGTLISMSQAELNNGIYICKKIYNDGSQVIDKVYLMSK